MFKQLSGVGRAPRACEMLISSALLILWLAFQSTTQLARAQTEAKQAQSTPDWQKAAGGKMEFEVASIRPAGTGAFVPPNFGLNIDDGPIPPGGLFTADFPLAIYIGFAYKIMPTSEQEQTMVAHLPKWVASDSFVIQAKAEGSPTKDQMRLMVQSLLADRFKLAVHFETRTIPALALVPLKPGQTGPRLRPHAEGLACDAKWIAPPDRGSPSVAPGGFMPVCGSVQGISGPNHTVILGARNITLAQIADYLPSVQDFGRPVLDQTGLSGAFDFSLNWLHERSGPSPSGADAQLDPGGPSLFEALKDQLGLRLKPVNTPVQVLVIDHVEPPSPN